MNRQVCHSVPISTFYKACTNFTWKITEKLLMIYRFHSTSTAIYWGIHPRAKPYRPSSTTQDHSQGTTCKKPQTSCQRPVLRTLVGLSLWTGRMRPWVTPKVRPNWAADSLERQGWLELNVCLGFICGNRLYRNRSPMNPRVPSASRRASYKPLSCSLDDVANGCGIPLTASWGEYTRLVQSVCYLLQREASFLEWHDGIHNLGSVIVS